MQWFDSRAVQKICEFAYSTNIAITLQESKLLASMLDSASA